MWNGNVKRFIVEVSSLDNVIVSFGGLKISTFARGNGDIFLESFDDSVVTAKGK